MTKPMHRLDQQHAIWDGIDAELRMLYRAYTSAFVLNI